MLGAAHCAPTPLDCSSARLPARDQHRVRLLLIEAGASGAEEHAQRRDGEHTVVIGQSSEELPTALAVRAVHHILVLERAGRQIESAVVLLAPRFDLEVTAARVLITRALSTHAASSAVPGCELLLRGRSELRSEILGLLTVLVGEPSSWSLPIRVRFNGCARDEVLPRASQTTGRSMLPCPPRRAIPALVGHRHRLRAVPDLR